MPSPPPTQFRPGFTADSQTLPICSRGDSRPSPECVCGGGGARVKPTKQLPEGLERL